MHVGQKLGPYELLAPIGAGGMGEVWKARDTRLDRTVAVKHSVKRFSDRFEREAHAIAALNHPHICTLYDVGPDYLVMEFVEGKPLRGPLPLKQALELGAQIADALHCAHSKGIVHRDLKPGNILLTKSGVKLLDFGLAKVQAQAAATDTTLTIAQPLTAENAILGTLQYMAPEQLEGRAADARSDIFALGLVLYEMICGQPAFAGKSQASLIAAILKEDPAPLGSRQPVTPPALERLVRKCLEKDPDERWQSAADLRDELRWLAEPGPQQEAPSPPRVLARPWLLMTLAVICAAMLVFAAFQLFSPRAPTWSGSRLGGPELAFGPRISPDGTTLAFQAMVRQNMQVAVLQPGSGNWEVLTHRSDTGYVNEISWSPDGTRLYYDRFADVPLGVYTVPARGQGEEQLLLPDAYFPEALPDGSLLVVKANAEQSLQVFRFWPDRSDSARLQGLPVEVGSAPAGMINRGRLRISKDGKEAFAVCRRLGDADKALHLYRIDLNSGAMHRVQTGLSHDDLAIHALAPGNEPDTILAAVRSSELVRVVAFPKSGSAAPKTLFTVTAPLQYLDCGPDGAIYGDEYAPSGTLLRFKANGGPAERIGFYPQSAYGQMSVLSGNRFAFLATAGDRPQLMSAEPGKDHPVPLVIDDQRVWTPITSVGREEVAFRIGPEAKEIGLASIANGRVTRRIPFDKGPVSSLSASPDGRTIYCAAGGTVWSIPPEGEPRKICRGDQVAVEPSGQSLVVKLMGAPKIRLMRVPLDGSTPSEIVLSGSLRLSYYGLSSAAISKDGRMLVLAVSLDSWFVVPGFIDLETGKTQRIPVDHFGDYQFLSWTPEGDILAAANDYRFALWRFRPERR